MISNPALQIEKNGGLRARLTKPIYPGTQRERAAPGGFVVVRCLGFEIWGLGFGVWGLGFGVCGLGFGV